MTDPDEPVPLVDNDIVLPFQIEKQAARGKLVRLGSTVDAIVTRRSYPAPVATLLGELAVLAALVSSALKEEGVLTAQIKGDGPVGMLVADATAAGAIRAYAAFDSETLDRATADGGGGDWRNDPVPRLVGAGYLAFTVDRGPATRRHQGIVELAGGSLADCARRHFRDSDQNRAAFKLAAAPDGPDGVWRAGGMMIQRLPDGGRTRLSGEAPDDDLEESWRRALALMGACTHAELVDGRLHPHDLLYRLFHEDGVRVFEPRALAHGCRCSRARVETTLRSFPRGEIEDLEVDGVVAVTCEFCGTRYAFDAADIARLYRPHLAGRPDRALFGAHRRAAGGAAGRGRPRRVPRPAADPVLLRDPFRRQPADPPLGEGSTSSTPTGRRPPAGRTRCRRTSRSTTASGNGIA